MPLFEIHDEDSLYLSMHDAVESLSRWAVTPFKLDERQWQTVEHYYQAMKFIDQALQQKIIAIPSPDKARKFATQWRLKYRVRKDWKKIKITIMIRATYIKCRTYPEIAEKLIATQEQIIVENSQFDYFWGCGRDKRGDNQYGKVLMNVRNKLITEQTDR
ncbi:NADAR family protein [Arenicella sp.]|nr:NADAR family protein [Arenicella sp.]